MKTFDFLRLQYLLFCLTFTIAIARMDQHDLRALILKLETRLSDDDRKRLHFFLGNDVPRRIRDDPSLTGTLNLIESLFDQDKINEQDFTFLIHAFEQIQCMDAVKLLRGNLSFSRAIGLKESTQTLNLIMPCQVEEIDKYAIRTGDGRLGIHGGLFDEQYIDNNVSNQNEMIDPFVAKKQSSNWFICPLLIILTLIVIIIVLFITFIRLKKDCQLKDNAELHQQLLQSYDQQRKQNETIERFINRTRSRSSSKIKSIAPIITTTTGSIKLFFH